MPIADKIAAAQSIQGLLNILLKHGGFRLKYRITVDPPMPEERDWERPQILVELAGPDAPLLLERNAELLRSFEHVTQQMLRLMPDEHEKVSFDAMRYRAMRIEELRAAANVAADRVRKSGMPYEFSPMTSRERRILHLALRDQPDLLTESAGEAGQRRVVLYPKGYSGARPTAMRMHSRSRR
ncbi:MAG: single-stranded DNA-binding protein [Acidobacteria bacterium]|nr:single-stranded DNA-binding protein [Acidobacteriota bacterium]